MLTALEQTKPVKIQTIQDALLAASDYRVVDYIHFEGTHKHRTYERQQFIAGNTYVPAFDYPYLEDLSDIEQAATAISQSLKIITSNIDSLGWDKAELYLASLIYNLKRAQLVMAAAQMNKAKSGSAAHMKAATEFCELNKQLYGDMNKNAWHGIMKTEYERAVAYKPKTEIAQIIRDDLLTALNFAKHYTSEERIISDELVATYRPKVLAMYGTILKVVPDNQEFDAHQCAEIMNAALKIGGLSDYGWRVVVDSKKTSPSTQGPKKRIYLPGDTHRTSEQLRGLILHEQEVHARRYQNGSHFTQFPPLSNGTAEYLPVEEGLGTIMALLAAPHETSPLARARARYIHTGLALGTDGQPRDARQVFDITWRIIALQQNPDGHIDEDEALAAENTAYPHIENIFRGTDSQTPGVIYTKAKVYYEGLLKASKHLMDIRGDNAAFVCMFLGKYNHADPTETAHIMRIIKPA